MHTLLGILFTIVGIGAIAWFCFTTDNPADVAEQCRKREQAKARGEFIA